LFPVHSSFPLELNNNQPFLSCLQQQQAGSDRFIADRDNMDMAAAAFNLASNTALLNCDNAPSTLQYQEAMKQNLMNGASAKILSLKQAPPAPKSGHQSDMQVLFSQNKENSVRTWKSKKSLRHIPNAPDRILDAPELRPDFYLNLIEWSSTNVVAVALEQSVYLWNAGDGSIAELPFQLEEGSSDYVSSVSWVQDGSFLAIGTGNSKVQVWDVTKQKKVRTINSGEGRVAAMDWNQHTLSTGTRHGDIMNHDVRIRDHHTQTLSGHTQEICGLKWSPDGKYLASGANDNVVNVWNEAGEQHCAPLTGHTAAVKALAWCPWQSNLLASGGGTADRCINFWNVNTGASVNRIDTKSQVSSLLWNKEHKEIISGHGYADNQLSIWSYPTMAKVADLTGHTDRVLSMSMSPDGTTVVSAAADETLRFWKCFASDPKEKKKVRESSKSTKMMTATIR
jgi:cell division cycle protein 20 (cofactor of APC complex)